MSDRQTDINAPPFVAKLISGDEPAFDELFKQLYPKLCLYISAAFKLDFRDAEEITQDALLNVAENIASFKTGRAKLTTWVYVIAKNQARDFLKHQKRIRNRDAYDDSKSIDSFEDATRQKVLSHEAIRIFKQILESEDTDTHEKKPIWELYNSLNKEEQDILFWRVIKGMSYEEISNLTGLDKNTLKVRYHRAEKKFARIVKDKISE